MTVRKPSLFFPVAVLVVLGVYVGAYYAMVKSMLIYHPLRYEPVYSIPIETSIENTVILDYRLSQFFAPIHWLDRRIRPGMW